MSSLSHCRGRTDRLQIGSLAKSWGAGGAVLVLPDDDMAEEILLAGATFTFSGPLHPAELGAANAAATIHLSEERDQREADLNTRIDHVRIRLLNEDLEVMGLDHTPVWFVRVGGPEAVVEVGKGIMADGYYPNISGFPVVPRHMDGVRFTTTLFQDIDRIDGFIDSLAKNIPPHYLPHPNA